MLTKSVNVAVFVTAADDVQLTVRLLAVVDPGVRVFALLVPLGYYLNRDIESMHGGTLALERNFYGVVRVYQGLPQYGDPLANVPVITLTPFRKLPRHSVFSAADEGSVLAMSWSTSSML